MATIKSYSDLQQSKKLAEILPLESADMHYNNASIKGINYADEYRAELMDYNAAQKVLSKYSVNPIFGIIPCWSLASLLAVLPDYTLQTDIDGTVFVVCESKKPVVSDSYDNPVDACVAMIEHLHELKIM